MLSGNIAQPCICGKASSFVRKVLNDAILEKDRFASWQRMTKF